MTISNFPAALQPLIQQGYLDMAVQEGLRSTLAFRSIADKEYVPVRRGESLTMTRHGLLAPITTPISPASNSGLDNGLSPQSWTMEQYVLTWSDYAATMDLNLVQEKVGIAEQFLINARALGVQAAQSIDRLARQKIFDTYLQGRTRVVTTLGSPGTTVAVDDIRGFTEVMVNGVPTAISATNTKAVTFNNAGTLTTYTLTGATADVTNVSTVSTIGGISGTLTFSSSVTVANATAGNAVSAADGCTVIRSGGAATTATMSALNTLTLSTLIDAVTVLKNNAVPGVSDAGGLYNCYLGHTSLRHLVSDPDFKLMFQGAGGTYTIGADIPMLGLRFIPTTETPITTLSGVGSIYRPVICGQGALIEAILPVLPPDAPSGPVVSTMVDDVQFSVRAPLDRRGQVVNQTWGYIGGFTAPSDTTASSTIIPSATAARYKRAIVVEHVG